MSRLELYLLGPPRFQLANEGISLPRRKVAALLIYLAVTAKAHSREVLIDLLFPKQTRERARADFRNTLSVLKSSIGNDRLLADGHGIYLETGDGLWIDVREFRNVLACDENYLKVAPRERIDALLEATRLYRGDFLSGFYLKDSVAFDEWQFLEQEALRRDYASALRRLVLLLEEQGDPEQAITYARAWLELDLVAEDAHRELMRLYAAAGNRTLALKQYQKCRDILAEELREDPDEETEQLAEAIRSHRDIGKRTVRRGQAISNLPVDPLPFIGREAELSRLLDTLGQNDVRILTLTGAAGTGKTRLAVEAVSRLFDRFANGIFFVDLLKARSPADVIPLIARALDVRESIGRGGGLFNLLSGYLRNRQVLLLIDNFEHVCGACSEVSALLSGCPGLKLLVTSRERLHIRGELEHQVPPLRLPEDVDDPHSLYQVDSVRLFVERAAATNPSFSFTDQNASEVAEICRRLDGLPLAIELAASRLNILSCRELLRMLGERRDCLQERASSRPMRHQTLRSAIDWSYNLLDDREKQLFTGCSVFSGGCSFQAVEHVCGESPGNSEADLLDTIASLVDKSLLRQEIVDGESRFSMLETIGSYGRARLENDNRNGELHRRHADYYLNLARTAEPELHGPDQLRWLDRLLRETGNLYAALAWMLEENKVAKALELAGSLMWFWYRAGHFEEGQKWLERTITADFAAKHPVLRAKVLNALGWMNLVQGNWAFARDLYQQSLRLFREQGDRAGEGIALSHLGAIDRWLGNRDSGDRCCVEAVRIAREVGDPLQISLALIWAFATTGGVFESVSPQAELEEAIGISRRLGNLWGVSHGLNGLGDFLRESKRYAEAKPRYEEALRGFLTLKDRWMTAWTLEGLGTTLAGLGDFPKAVGHLSQGLSLFHELGDRGNSVYMLGRLAMAARAAGDHLQAACLLGACHVLYGDSPASAASSPCRDEEESERLYSEYRKDYAEQWSRGQVMSYEQAVQFALSLPRF